MKTNKQTLLTTVGQAFLFMLFFIIAVTGCYEKEFDSPPIEAPHYDGEANISIKAFKDSFNSATPVLIEKDYIISGIVIANDISGNLYQQLFIEDDNEDDKEGLLISIERTNLYVDYRLGQKIFIETKGLYMGKYGGMLQLGFPYKQTHGTEAIGRIPWLFFKDKVFKHDFPNPELVKTNNISFNEIRPEYYGRLVTFDNVEFEDSDGSEKFSFPTEDNRIQTLNRTIRSAENPLATVVARMSSASNFASKTIPTGVGRVTGILTVYNNTVQLLVRDSLDIDFKPNPDGWGTKNSPWTVNYAINNQDANKKGWVKGVIVGSLFPGVGQNKDITSNEDIIFGNDNVHPIFSHIVIAESENVRDWTKCAVVNLPAGSQMSNEVNLFNNPNNIGKEIIVLGDLMKTMNAAGILVDRGTKSEYELIEIIILHVPFRSTLTPFTEFSVLGDQKWVWDSRYTCAYMTGFVNSTNNANEDWLISPSIDLTKYNKANVSFDHAHRFGKPQTDFTLWISSNYSSGAPSSGEWTQLNIINYSDGANYNFHNSGKINIPAEFTSKNNIRIAFKYLSTSANQGAGTWEIRDVFVKAGQGEVESTQDPALTTLPAANITPTSATLGGNITFAGNPAYTVRGVCYSTSQNPTTSDTTIPVSGSGTGEFSTPVTGLTTGVTYYVRAYATNPNGTFYGNQVSFTTTSGGGSEVFFLETFGTGNYPDGSRPKVNVFDDFDNKSPVIFSDPTGNADIRSTTAINAHVWLPANRESKLIIEGIDISGYNNVKLSYDLRRNVQTASITSDKLLVKINDDEQIIPVITIVDNVYTTITISENIAATGIIKIEFHATAANNTVGFRLDNIKLTGEPTGK